MKKKLLGTIAIFAIYFTSLHSQTSFTFNYTGSPQTYTVPANITIISVTVAGAQGGGGGGAPGASYQHTLGVSPGQVLQIYTGGSGITGANALGGYNGGGNAGGNYGNEGSGGGASDIRVTPYGLANRIIVAGGGGGSGGYAGAGGGFGGLIGMPGGTGQGGGGGGGNATSGGNGGAGYGCNSGSSGTLGNGGAGGGSCVIGGGGGGGGYYGGGGGGADYDYCCADGGGAGGGSSYCTVSGGTCTSGAWYGSGRVIIKELTGLSITLVSPVICNGESNAALAANMSGGGAPFTYSWSTGATTSSVSGLAAGTYTCWVTNSLSVTFSEIYTISQPQAFTSGLSWQNNLTCNGGNNGYVNVYANGGVFPYSYSWFPSGGNLATVSNLTAGSYTCFITDANNCVTTVTTVLTQPPPVNVVAFATSTSICIGDNVTLMGGGASYYSWSNGVQDATPFMPTITNSYVVTGYDWNGCPGYALTHVVVNPLPIVSFPSSSITTCFGAPTTLSATGASTYSWSNNTTGLTTVVSPTVPTTYTVTGTSTLGCKNTSTIAVGIYSLPVISAILSSTAVCEGKSFTMLGLGAFTFTIAGGPTNGVPYFPASTSVYTVSGTNTNGCVNSTTLTVVVNPIPTVAISGPSNICQGTSTTLTAGGANTYTWNTGPTQTSSIFINPQSSTNYTVIGLSAQGCSNTGIFALVVNPSPTITLNTSNTTLCQGSSLMLIGNGANSYTWAPFASNSSSVSISPSVTTTYSLVGSSSGCNSSAFVTVSLIATPTLSLVSSGTVCALTSVTLSAGGANTYTWNNGLTTATVVVNPASTGWIRVSGTGSNGCIKTDSIYQVVKPIPPLLITSSNNGVVCEGETTSTLVVTGAASYSWSTQQTDSTIIVTPSISTTYFVSSTGANGCSNTISYLIDVTICTGITEAVESPQIHIYPNPNNGIFTVKTDKDLKLNLLNSLGQLIKTLSLNESNMHSIEITGLSNGLYFLVSETSDQHINEKIIITN